MSAYTPGPWEYVEGTLCDHKGEPYSDYISVKAADGSSILWMPADVFNHDDARLIAAAPELLEACELALGAFDGAPINFSRDNVTAIMALREAIARATGEQQ